MRREHSDVGAFRALDVVSFLFDIDWFRGVRYRGSSFYRWCRRWSFLAWSRGLPAEAKDDPSRCRERRRRWIR